MVKKDERILNGIIESLRAFAQELGHHPDLVDDQLYLNVAVSIINVVDGYDSDGNKVSDD